MTASYTFILIKDYIHTFYVPISNIEGIGNKAWQPDSNTGTLTHKTTAPSVVLLMKYTGYGQNNMKTW